MVVLNLTIQICDSFREMLIENSRVTFLSNITSVSVTTQLSIIYICNELKNKIIMEQPRGR